MRISLHGSYYANNYGDILLMEMFTRWLREYDPSIMINYPLLNKTKILDIPDGTNCGFLSFLCSDALVFFGGGYFGERPEYKIRWSIRNFIRHVLIALSAMVLKKPYAIIGVEFGPLSISWFRRCALFIAKKADCLVVRNQESFDFLVRNGVTNVKLSCDAVLSLSDYYKPKTTCSNTILLHIAGRNTKTLINYIIVFLKEQNIDNVVILEDEEGQMSRSQLGEMLDSFEESGISYKILKYKGPDGVVEAVNESEMIITTKLHVGITGIALNKKVFSVYTHPKTQRFHKQVGNEGNCISINEVDETIVLRLKELLYADTHTVSSDVLEAARDNKKAMLGFLDSCVLEGVK